MASTRRVGEVFFNPMLAQVNEQVEKIRSNPIIDFEAFRALGVHKADLKAQQIMKDKIVRVLSPNTEFQPLKENPTVYFVYEKTQKIAHEVLSTTTQAANVDKSPIAVLKLGNKRANIELAAREIAHLLGLADYVAPGVFFGREGLSPHSTWEEEDFAYELWNGKMKEYDNTSSATYFGILEAYIDPKSTEQSKEKLFPMLLLTALAIGLRDGRKDNITSMIIDAEECMPERIEAPEHLDKAVAATHLPYFVENQDILQKNIDASDVKAIKAIIMGWNIEKILDEVSKKKILFPDIESESSAFHDVDSIEGSDVEEDLDLQDHLYTPKSCINTETSIFDNNQIQAFGERLSRLKNFIEKSPHFSCNDMIQAVDPEYIQGFEVAKQISRLSEEAQLGQLTRPYSSSQRSESVGRQSTPLVRGLSVQEAAQAELDRIRAERDEALLQVKILKEQLEQMTLGKGRRQKSESISSSGGSPLGSPVHLLEKSTASGSVAKPTPRPSRFVPLVSANKIDLPKTVTQPRKNNEDVEVEFIFGTFSSRSSSRSSSESGSSSSASSSSSSESSSSSSESSSSSSESSSESDTE